MHVAMPGWSSSLREQYSTVVMGPGFRRDDTGDCSASHRRREPVAADVDAGGFEGTVVLLGGAEDDELGARLHFALVRRDEGDDRRIRRHHDFLLAVLVLDQDVLAV